MDVTALLGRASLDAQDKSYAFKNNGLFSAFAERRPSRSVAVSPNIASSRSLYRTYSDPSRGTYSSWKFVSDGNVHSPCPSA